VAAPRSSGRGRRGRVCGCRWPRSREWWRCVAFGFAGVVSVVRDQCVGRKAV